MFGKFSPLTDPSDRKCNCKLLLHIDADPNHDIDHRMDHNSHYHRGDVLLV